MPEICVEAKRRPSELRVPAGLARAGTGNKCVQQGQLLGMCGCKEGMGGRSVCDSAEGRCTVRRSDDFALVDEREGIFRADVLLV